MVQPRLYLSMFIIHIIENRHHYLLTVLFLFVCLYFISFDLIGHKIFILLQTCVGDDEIMAYHNMNTTLCIFDKNFRESFQCGKLTNGKRTKNKIIN